MKILLERYGILVNKKFETGLSPEENAEMESIGKEIDKCLEPYDLELIHRLKQTLARNQERKTNGRNTL